MAFKHDRALKKTSRKKIGESYWYIRGQIDALNEAEIISNQDRKDMLKRAEAIRDGKEEI